MYCSMKALLQAISNDPGYRQLHSALENGDGTVAVFGLSEAHRPAVNAALAEDKTVLWVAPTPAEAMRLYELQRAYRPDTGLFCRANCRLCTWKRSRPNAAPRALRCFRGWRSAFPR